MSDLDPEEDAVLESARRAFSPPDAVTRRMRAALVAKLAAPGVIVASSAAATSGGAVTSSTAVASSAAAAAGATAAGVAVTSGSSAPLAAVGGAIAGGAKIAASAAILKVAAGVTTVALLATATSSYWLPEASAPAAAPARAVTASGPSPSRRTAARNPNAPMAPVPSDENARAASPQPAERQAPPLAGPGAAIQGGAPRPELQGELDVLRRAQQAIQAGQPSLALGLLGRLDAEHPTSSLRQEREVARVLALCGVGRVSAAREIAQRILAASPNSLYAGRIQASCAAVPAVNDSNSASRAPASTSVRSPEKSTNGAPPVARFGDSGN